MLYHHLHHYPFLSQQSLSPPLRQDVSLQLCGLSTTVGTRERRAKKLLSPYPTNIWDPQTSPGVLLGGSNTNSGFARPSLRAGASLHSHSPTLPHHRAFSHSYLSSPSFSTSLPRVRANADDIPFSVHFVVPPDLNVDEQGSHSRRTSFGTPTLPSFVSPSRPGTGSGSGSGSGSGQGSTHGGSNYSAGGGVGNVISGGAGIIGGVPSEGAGRKNGGVTLSSAGGIPATGAGGGMPVLAGGGNTNGIPGGPTNDDIEAIIQAATSSGRSTHVGGNPLRDTRTQLFVGNVSPFFLPFFFQIIPVVCFFSG